MSLFETLFGKASQHEAEEFWKGFSGGINIDLNTKAQTLRQFSEIEALALRTSRKARLVKEKEEADKKFAGAVETVLVDGVYTVL